MNALDRSIAIGSLGLSLGQLLLVLSMVVALIVGAWVGRRRKISVGDHLFNVLFMGLVGARIVFVARYWESYDTFWSWLDIRDRGFEPLAGLAIAFVYLTWRLWRHPDERRPLGAAVFSGALVWTLTAGALALMAPGSATIPTTPLVMLDSNRIALPDIQRGAHRPMVVNVWASWCPPCRRDMPMLEQAQQARDDVSFVFVNQGESVDAVETFLQRESLSLDHLYRDPDMTFAREVGAMAMPTTLYYDADGQLIDTHFGELSRATLDRSLERFDP